MDQNIIGAAFKEYLDYVPVSPGHEIFWDIPVIQTFS